jgi:NAD(P)-dependent dehydrogenase (short-subunit alcohol dehydrogenase family)
MTNLEGQTAPVTGATSGIGRAIALRLGRDGAEVVVHGRDHTCGQEVLNNAGFSWFGPTHYFDAETFHSMFASNVRSGYLLVAAPAPKMAARGTGSIVKLSGMAARVGLVGVAAHSATRASMEEMTRSWAAEFGPGDVRVNTIAPGPVLTPGAPPELGETTIMMKRAAQPEEIAEVVAFLVSPAATPTSPARQPQPMAVAWRPSAMSSCGLPFSP